MIDIKSCNGPDYNLCFVCSILYVDLPTFLNFLWKCRTDMAGCAGV